MKKEVSTVQENDSFDLSVYQPETLTDLFVRRAKASLNQTSVYAKDSGHWRPYTWRDALEAVQSVSSGLLALEVKRGDTIAIISNTRREWSQLDMATMFVGGITVGIYPTLTAEQTAYVLQHSETKIVVVENAEQLAKVEQGLGDAIGGVKLITIESIEERPDIERFEAFCQRGRQRAEEYPTELEARRLENKPDDVVTYVYTSGTTGEPKGAMLTHANFHYVINASIAAMSYEDEISLSFLPLAHSLQRYANYLALLANVQGYFAESLDKVADNIAEVRPTCFATVPRILEKIHIKVLNTVQEQGGVKEKIFNRAMAVLHEAGEARRNKRSIGLGLRVRARIADRLVAKKIRERIGGRVSWLGCGGAPLVREVNEFFDDIGVPILEGYGLTETSAPATINTLSERKIGTVGKPLPGTEVTIDTNGEILVRGPGVFVGYYKNEEATKKVFTSEGWFRTGDVGRFDDEGFLMITDRIKDLIITAGGKNIAPQPIEALLKSHEFIGQAVVIGDKRPYLSALIGIDGEAIDSLIERYKLTGSTGFKDLSKQAAFRDDVQRHVDEVNSRLPKFEQIKRWNFLEQEMTIESGELTPTLKVKRRIIHERYGQTIEELYS